MGVGGNKSSFASRSGCGGRGGTCNEKSSSFVGTVKSVDNDKKAKENKVRVKVDGSRSCEYIYVLRKHTKNLKPERQYNFHLEDEVFRGGGTQKSSNKMIRRTVKEPTEVSKNGFGKR